jgi:hypothetical protein
VSKQGVKRSGFTRSDITLLFRDIGFRAFCRSGSARRLFTVAVMAAVIMAVFAINAVYG